MGGSLLRMNPDTCTRLDEMITISSLKQVDCLNAAAVRGCNSLHTHIQKCINNCLQLAVRMVPQVKAPHDKIYLTMLCDAADNFKDAWVGTASYHDEPFWCLYRESLLDDASSNLSG